MIKTVLHWFQHLFKRNSVKVVTWNENGFICIGFECVDCGKTTNVEKITESELLNGKYGNDDSNIDSGTTIR